MPFLTLWHRNNNKEKKTCCCEIINCYVVFAWNYRLLELHETLFNVTKRKIVSRISLIVYLSYDMLWYRMVSYMISDDCIWKITSKSIRLYPVFILKNIWILWKGIIYLLKDITQIIISMIMLIRSSESFLIQAARVVSIISIYLFYVSLLMSEWTGQSSY